MKSQTAVARGATSLYVANVIFLIANTLYFLVLTNVLRSTLDVGIVTALNITIWLLVTLCILAQPITVQSPIPAPLAVLKFLPELMAKRARTDAARVFRTSLGTAGILGAAIAGTLAVFPDLIIPFIGGQAIQPDFVRLSALDVLVISLGQVCIGALVAMGDMKTASIYIISWSIVRYASASLLLIAYSISGVLIGWIIGDAALLGVALWSSIRQVHGDTHSARSGEIFALHSVQRANWLRHKSSRQDIHASKSGATRVRNLQCSHRCSDLHRVRAICAADRTSPGSFRTTLQEENQRDA